MNVGVVSVRDVGVRVIASRPVEYARAPKKIGAFGRVCVAFGRARVLPRTKRVYLVR